MLIGAESGGSPSKPEVKAMDDYYMPVARAAMYPPVMGDCIRQFFDAAPRDDLDQSIVGLRIDIFSSGEDTDHFITDVALRLYGGTTFPKTIIYEAETKSLTGSSLLAFKDLLYNLHVFGGHIPYSDAFEKVIPWSDPKLKNSFKNAYISLHEMRDFTLITKEYLPSWISGHKSDLIGPNARIEDRRAFCSMVIPPVETSHEEIEQVARQGDMADLARGLYEHLVDQGMDAKFRLPLSSIEFSKVEEFTK
jgi:hypothetical protein